MSYLRDGWKLRPRDHGTYTFGRVAGLADGIYAIVATLLILEIQLPEEIHPGRLGDALRTLGDDYLAYVLGFVQILGGWVNNRRMNVWMHGIDYYGQLLVLGSLFPYTAIPFTVAVLARAFGNTADLGTAVRLMAIVYAVSTMAWSCLLIYARRRGFFRRDLDQDVFELYYRLALGAWVTPLAALLVSYFSPQIGLAIIIGFSLFILTPAEAHPAEREHRNDPGTNSDERPAVGWAPRESNPEPTD